MEVFAKTRQCSASLPSSNELAFTQDWSNITKAVERKLSTVLQNLTRSVAGYVVKVSGEASNSSGQIPTALVLASVNTPDHSALYGQLRELIISEGGIVALLESDTDVSTARGIIAAMFNQLNSSNEPPFSELEQNSLKRTSTLDLPTSLKSTFLAISLWYDVNVLEHSSRPLETTSSPMINSEELMTDISANQKLKSRKPLLPQTSNHPTEAVFTKQKTAATPSHYHKRTTMDRRKSATPKRDAVSAIAAVPKVSKRLSRNVRNSSSGGTENAPVLRPLVVVIPAIETISATVLRDFIELAFLYSSTCATSQPSSDEGKCPLGRQNMFGALPIRFVFGLSGAADLGLEVRCDAMTLSRLAIKRFKTPSPTVFLQAALTEMIHTPGFRMSRCMLNFVVDSVYMCVDYSIENFLKRTKACMLLHYQNLRHPQLLQALDISSSYIHSLNYEDLTELVATYPSLAEIVAEAPADILCARITECLKSHWLSQLLLPRILSWLLALFACLEIRPLPSTLPDLYRNWLSGDLSTSPAFSQTLSLLKILNKTRVIAAVDSSLGSLMASIGLLSSVKCDANPTVAGVQSLADVRYKPLLSAAIATLLHLKETVANWRVRLLEAPKSVACGSLSCGLGDVTFLTMATFFEISVISTWSSGTGAAGIAGSVFYAIVTSFVSPEVTLRATIFVPVAMLFTYLFMLDKPPLPVFDLLRSSPCKSACCPQRTYYTVLSENGRVFEADEPNTQADITNEAEGELEVVDVASSLDPYVQDTQSRLDWTTKCRLLMSIFPLLVSLALVYFFEYLINQALFELIFFDTSNLTHAQQYRWFQVLYQCGVFISRSSVRLIQFKRTWIMAVLQALNFGICLLQTIKPFMPSIWLMFTFILYEGILGGLSYVNTFHRIITETEPAHKEYSMAVAAFADGLGITAAGLLSVPLHNALCRLLN